MQRVDPTLRPFFLLLMMHAYLDVSVATNVFVESFIKSVIFGVAALESQFNLTMLLSIVF